MKNRRIERATKKTVGLFNKKNCLKEEVEISLVLEIYDCLEKEIKKLDKIDRKYEKAHARLEKLETKNHCRKIGIMEAVEA